MSPSTVLVTGAGRFVSGQLAARLAADLSIDRVVAVDSVLPGRALSRRLGRAEFVSVDLRSPLIAKVISDAKVDTRGARLAQCPPAQCRWTRGEERAGCHRHDAASRGLPTLDDGGPAGREVHRRGVRAEPTPSGCWPLMSWWGCGRRDSRASASATATGTSCSGSTEAGSSPQRCGVER